MMTKKKEAKIVGQGFRHGGSRSGGWAWEATDSHSLQQSVVILNTAVNKSQTLAFILCQCNEI